MRTALVLGTGLTELPFPVEPIEVETPWGDVEMGHSREHALFALSRHGSARRPAHVIDHKANIDALARCKVERIVALNTVGALDEGIASGSLVVPDDYLDMRSEKSSFFDASPIHVDVAEAYCPTVRSALVDAGRHAHALVVDRGVYVATEGPRLETRAEVRMLRQLGGSVVGMTGCPEAALARERAICYASLCLVTNPAAGVSRERTSAASIRAAASAMAPLALRVALAAAKALPASRGGCACAKALEGARL